MGDVSPVTGIEVALGFLVAWALKKAKRVAQRADTEVDRALDAGMDRLHDLVSRKLGPDPALAKLQTEVEESGAASTRTQDRVRLSLEDAAETDTDFAAQLEKLASELETLQGQAGVTAGDHGTAVGGDVNLHAEGGSVAAWQVGNVSFGGDRPDPSSPGRPTA